MLNFGGNVEFSSFVLLEEYFLCCLFVCCEGSSRLGVKGRFFV